jgi:amino acid adenylation domain-containing protein
MDRPRDTSEAKVAPLSYEQWQLWLLRELVADSVFENDCQIIIMRGSLDAKRLHESLRAFIRRHEIWRTVFPVRDGQPVQVVTDDDQCGWSTVDLTELADKDAEKRTLELAREDVARPVDIARGPLVRATLVRLGSEEHRLILTLHRLVFDDVSLASVFLPELRESYDASAECRAPRLRDVPVQYPDYAAGQHHGDSAAHLAFWTQHLRDAPTVLELPVDHQRPPTPGYLGAATEFALGQGLGAELRELSRCEQVPLSVTLTSGFATLLHRYTGQDDLLVGITASPRERPELRHAMGRFDNAVVLRADLAGDPSAAEVLQRTRAACTALREHDRVPFEEVVRAVRPERRPGQHPLVQVLFACQQDGEVRPAGGWEIAPTALCPPIANFDLCVQVDEQAEDLTGRVIYRTDLFEPGTIIRLIEHWRMILAGMAAEPARPVGELRLVTDAETRQLLRDWNASAAGPAESVEQMIRAAADTGPAAVAVVCAGAHVTYRELDGKANQLARHLTSLGAGPEIPVGVCIERSVEQVVALLAILRAGAAYVPMDPDTPADRIRYMMQDSGMPLVVSRSGLQHKLAGAAAAAVMLDRDRALIDRHSAGEVPELATADQLAYVIYTSGSTGRPKGVMVERGALAAHCRAMIGQYGLGPDDRVLQFSQFSFDASLEQILPALAAGSRLVMRGSDLWSPRELLEEMAAQQVTVMNLPPAYWHQAVRQWRQEPDGLPQLRLRLVIVGGDRLEPSWVREWNELGLAGVRLLNAYGPTETTITATIGDAGAEQDLVTIGTPTGGRRICVLDRRGQLVPLRVVGELHIGGPLLARGYLNRPQLTAERFVPDPFARQEGHRLYKTGDLARRLPDGRFEYIGREDQQIKIRGYRIELGEIEGILNEHPAVGDAVAVTDGEGPDKILVAYVVSRTGEPVTDELRTYLSERVPRYMQPAIIQQLDRLPMLPTGKPDRRGLPPVNRAERRDGEYVAPRLLLEKQLVQVWEDLLAVRPVGIDDNFFDLGGHSLLAAQLVGRIEQLYGRRIALSTLFARPTIGLLAEALNDDPSGSQRRARVLPVQTGGSRTPFFFLHGDWTGGAFYCFTLARACGAEQPFYVLEPYRFSATDGAPTFEEMARAHVEGLRSVQPRGPYRIGGFCNGGLLAYEMARQLSAEGELVEFLGLVNPSEPFQFSALRAACQAVNKVTKAGRSRLADLYLRARHAQRHLYRLVLPSGRRVEDFGKLLAIEPRLERMFPPRDALYADYVGVFNWAVAAYRPGPYGSKVTFYWAREEPGIARSWRPVTARMNRSECEEHTVDGALMSSVTEHVASLAEVLSQSLSQAEQDNGS